MTRVLALAILLGAIILVPVAALAHDVPRPSVLAVPHRGPSVLGIPYGDRPSVLNNPQPPLSTPPHGHFRPYFVPHRQPLWVQPQWMWNGWQWVWVPGYWTW